MRDHPKLLVAVLLAVGVFAVAPAFAATTRSDAIAVIRDAARALSSLIDEQADIADRIELLRVSGSTASRDALADDARELKVKLENLELEIQDIEDKVNSLKLARASAKANSEHNFLEVSCKVSASRPKVGETVTYEAKIDNGSAKGATYSWSGDFAGVAPKEHFYFTAAGTFDAQVEVKNQAGQTARATCPKVVVTAAAPGSGSTSARATGAAITVVAPQDGAELEAGRQVTFSWKHRGLRAGERLNISIKGEDGTRYFIRTSQLQGEGGVGSYVWTSAGTTPNGFVPNGDYTLQICTDDGVLCGVSSLSIVED